MNITVIGTGYVGLTLGAGLANLGNHVCCLDILEEKINKLRRGEIPFYEPGIKTLVQRNVEANRLRFTTNKQEAIMFGELIFIAVGTPSQKDEQGNYTQAVDLQYVDMAAKDIATYMQSYKLVVNKSTVPVGTAQRVRNVVQQELLQLGKQLSFDVASNPEFLREGAAIKDFENPDRIIVGVDSEKAKELMKKLYKPLQRVNKPIMVTDIKSAEMIKYAANAMLATRISFMNEISRLCEKTGADIKEIAKGIGLDNRIGSRFLQAGAGYGGSCFPKDVRGFIAIANQHGLGFPLLQAVDQVNEEQKQSLLPKIKQLLGPDLSGKKIAIWGLAFKPKTDDIREATSLVLIKQLLHEGAMVVAYDPEAIENTKQFFSSMSSMNTQSESEKLSFTDNAYACVQDADCLVLVTEWHEFRLVDFNQVAQQMKTKNVIDGRNVYAPQDLIQKGFKYLGVGRGRQHGQETEKRA